MQIIFNLIYRNEVNVMFSMKMKTFNSMKFFQWKNVFLSMKNTAEQQSITVSFKKGILLHIFAL